MRHMIVVLALLAGVLLLPHKAAAAEPTMGVAEQLSSTHTCRGIEISSFTTTAGYQAVDVVISTTPAWRFVTVQNLDSTNDIFCAERVNVSSNPVVNGGFGIANGAPGSAATFYLTPSMKWYCTSGSTTGTSWAIVCRGR